MHKSQAGPADGATAFLTGRALTLRATGVVWLGILIVVAPM